MAPVIDPNLPHAWRERITRQVTSGLSIADFCEREALSQTAFYHWKRKFKTSSDSPPRPAFLPLQVLPEQHAREQPRQHSEATIEVTLPSGMSVYLSGKLDHDLACQLITILANQACVEARRS